MYKFELTYNGTTTLIDEPEGFTDFQSEIKRDFNTGGIFYKYVSGDLKLGFVGEGRTILETAYQEKGIDANVTLTISKRPNKYTSYTVIFEGKAILENREYDIDYLKVDFEQIEFIEKLKNRIDLKIPLDATTDLDGNVITPPTAYTIPFHTKGIKKESIFNPSDQNLVNSPPSLTSLALFFPYDEPTTDDLGDITNVSNGGVWQNNSDPTIRSPQIELTEEGLCTFTYDYDIKAQLTSGTETGTKTVDYVFYLGVYDSDDTLVNTYTLDSGSQNITIGAPAATEIFSSGSQTFNGVKGYKIRHYYTFEISGGSDSNLILERLDGWFWKLDQVTKFKETNVKIFTYFDVFSHVVNSISGADFYSDYLGLIENGYANDGCAGLNGMTGGYYLRGINTAPQVSLKQLLDDIVLRWGLGWSVEKSEYGYRVRVEPIEFFYSDLLIQDFGSDIINYQETVTDEIPNEIVLGYSKYATQERFPAVIDDWCTEVQFSTPIIKKKKKLELKTDIISSPYLIEFTRREGAINEGWKYDEDVFHVDLIRGYDGATYEFAPRKVEDFTNVSGIIDPDNPYNLHHHPVYFLFNQGMYLNSWMYGKTIADKYRNQFFAVNKDLQAEYTGSCNHLEPLEIVTTSGSYEIIKVNQGLSLFTTDEIKFQIALTNAQVNEIINSHENNGTSNYGYFRFTDPDGVQKEGYLLNLVYNPIDEIGTFTLIKRRTGIYEA